jgi:hypothetical protein
MQNLSKAGNCLLPLAQDLRRSNYFASVNKWAIEVDGEEYISRIMEAFDKSLFAKPGEEVLLNLSFSGISRCPPFFSGLTHLKLVSVPLKEWPDNLPDTLIHLMLKDCAWVTALPDNLSSQLPKLKHLDLTNTSITILPISQLATLEFLRITGCEQLEELPQDFLDQMPQLAQFLTANSSMGKWVFYALSERSSIEKRMKAVQLGPCYKQNYPRSCAAASLLSIAFELGIKTMPALENKGELVLDKRCESDLYLITSEYHEVMSELSSARGSLPPNIIRASKLLGLTEKFYVPKNHYTEAMRKDSSYPDIEIVSKKEGIDINIECAPLLKEGELAIKFLVEVDSSGKQVPGLWDEVTHCIVERPDGSCMDPSFGENFHTASELIANYDDTQEIYVDSGMSIVFTCV